jgi:murein DD-endopeptidase MepM/ murein hydrolase activator NlpD
MTIIFGISIYTVIAIKFNTPKEKILKEENKDLYFDVYIMNNRLNYLTDLLNDVEQNDSLVYRTIFETDPYYRNYDTRSIIKYDSLSKIDKKYLVELTHKKILKLERYLTDEYKDIQKIKVLAEKKRDYLESVPNIQPISNKDLKRTASGWGWRIHPIYHIKKFHFGLDFTSPVGTNIYSTGKGRVVFAGTDQGYGNVVIIDHGYNYKTLYGHMSKIEVKTNQEVKRGQIIGLVGNTGLSTGPHLHYEVMFNEKKVNPVGFFFNDLSVKEFNSMIDISSNMNMTFD